MQQNKCRNLHIHSLTVITNVTFKTLLPLAFSFTPPSLLRGILGYKAQKHLKSNIHISTSDYILRIATKQTTNEKGEMKKCARFWSCGLKLIWLQRASLTQLEEYVKGHGECSSCAQRNGLKKQDAKNCKICWRRLHPDLLLFQRWHY